MALFLSKGDVDSLLLKHVKPIADKLTLIEKNQVSEKVLLQEIVSKLDKLDNQLIIDSINLLNDKGQELLDLLKEALLPVPAPTGVLTITMTGENEMAMIFTVGLPAPDPALPDTVSRRLTATVDGQPDQVFELGMTETEVPGVRCPEDENCHLALVNIDNKGNPSAPLEADFVIPDSIGPATPTGTLTVTVTDEQP